VDEELIGSDTKDSRYPQGTGYGSADQRIERRSLVQSQVMNFLTPPGRIDRLHKEIALEKWTIGCLRGGSGEAETKLEGNFTSGDKVEVPFYRQRWIKTYLELKILHFFRTIAPAGNLNF